MSTQAGGRALGTHLERRGSPRRDPRASRRSRTRPSPPPCSTCPISNAGRSAQNDVRRVAQVSEQANERALSVRRCQRRRRMRRAHARRAFPTWPPRSQNTNRHAGVSTRATAAAQHAPERSARQRRRSFARSLALALACALGRRPRHRLGARIEARTVESDGRHDAIRLQGCRDLVLHFDPLQKCGLAGVIHAEDEHPVLDLLEEFEPESVHEREHRACARGDAPSRLASCFPSPCVSFCPPSPL